VDRDIKDTGSNRENALLRGILRSKMNSDGPGSQVQLTQVDLENSRKLRCYFICCCGLER
jgi:hypothetical protein